MSNSDVIIDDVENNVVEKFVISYHQKHHLKKLG